MHKDKLKTRASNKAYKDGLNGIDWSVGREDREAAREVEDAAKAVRQANRGQGMQIIRDIDPFIEPIHGKVIGGNAQKREFMKKEGVIDCGNERPKTRPQKRDPVGPDIKKAIEQLESR